MLFIRYFLYALIAQEDKRSRGRPQLDLPAHARQFRIADDEGDREETIHVFYGTKSGRIYEHARQSMGPSLNHPEYPSFATALFRQRRKHEPF